MTARLGTESIAVAKLPPRCQGMCASLLHVTLLFGPRFRIDHVLCSNVVLRDSRNGIVSVEKGISIRYLILHPNRSSLTYTCARGQAVTTGHHPASTISSGGIRYLDNEQLAHMTTFVGCGEERKYEHVIDIRSQEIE